MEETTKHDVWVISFDCPEEFEGRSTRKRQAPGARKMFTAAERFRILKRDSFRCQLCGVSTNDGARLEIDHRHSIANGGSNEEVNLWTLCFDCNRGKGRDSIHD